FRLTVPPWEVTRWAYDKRLTYQMASQVGVAIPRTYYPGGREGLAEIDCAFPVILKPAYKERELNRLTASKAWRADDRESLGTRYDSASDLVGPERLMVQELIPGGGEHQFSFAALCRAGRPLVSLIAQRLRQYPADFG